MNRKERRAAEKRSPAGGAQAQAEAAQLFAEAIRLHEQGRALDADAACRAAIERDATHAGALHLLGVVAMQRGVAGEAVVYFGKAAQIRPDIAIGHHSLGKALAATGQLEAAAGAFERALALQPDFAEVHKDLGAVLVQLGRLRPAAASFARALSLVPELVEDFAGTEATLRAVNPALGAAVARAVAAWPRLLPIEEMFGAPGLSAVAEDPLLLRVLTTTTVRAVPLERCLTAVRAALLGRAEGLKEADNAILEFVCALARQCFNNEYVFAEGSEESESVERLSAEFANALEQGTPIAPLRLAVLASYRALGSRADADRLVERNWPAAVDALLTQQVREVGEERRLRAAMPQITAIADDANAAVRQQYEENPYPRWVVAPSRPQPIAIDDYLKRRFPLSPFRYLGDRRIEILVAGCGTGEHSIGAARRFANVSVLGIDFSTASLAYAQRKSRELGVPNVEHAQADVLKIGSSGRVFDVIDSSGVLHHLSEPMAGWASLLEALRPGGLMRIGLYSERGRAAIVAARAFIAAHAFAGTAVDIRRSRQALLEAGHHVLANYADFFSMSGCRDLLFHVQEHRLDLSRIKQFLQAHDLTFLGFELDASAMRAYGIRHPGDPAMRDLDAWEAFEAASPETFAGMYQFWCQRN